MHVVAATLLVPGVGSSKARVAYIRRTWNNPDGFVFDYDSRTPLIDAVDFFKNKRRGSSSDRVQRLVKDIKTIGTLYGGNLKILAHSHGALLVYRALQALYKTDPALVKNLEVTAYGPGQPIPVKSPTLVLRRALNKINIDDWVQKVSSAFTRALKLKDLPLGREVSVKDGAKLYSIVVLPPGGGHLDYEWKNIAGGVNRNR